MTMSLAIDHLDYMMSEVSHWEEYMEPQNAPVDVEALKAKIKKLNAQATNLKMNLHDLAEDLPTGWEKIPEVAQQAYQAYKSLTEARGQLAGASG
jgi:hypothetical protein